MAYYDKDDDSGSSAKFSGDELQTRRVDESLRKINLYRSAPEVFDEVYMKPYYLLWFDEECVLHGEIYPYLSEEEKKKSIDLKERIEKIIENKPVWEDKVYFSKKKKVLNKENLKKIKKILDIFDREIRSLGVRHSIISTTKEEDIEGL